MYIFKYVNIFKLLSLYNPERNIQGVNQPWKMSYNAIFPVISNFLIVYTLLLEIKIM